MASRDIILLILTLVAVFYSSAIPVNVVDVKGYTKLRGHGDSALYRVQADTKYDVNPLLIHLVGSRYDMGYSFGYLLSKEIDDAYHSLLISQLGDKWYDKVLMDALGAALDWQWKDYLSQKLPTEYKRELQGLADGAADMGCTACGNYTTRAIVLANSPGDLKDYLYVLLREFGLPSLAEKIKFSTEKSTGLQCSMFAVWGNRSENGELFSARNLDWNKDTGINKDKIVMVMVPNDGGIPSATLGFVGLYGTLAGMSAQGITVAEANLEEDQISFDGFPWTIRLRYIMEFAKDITTAKQLWDSTNNTVGFNHMVASSSDAVAFKEGKTKTVALAMETMYGYTAYFADNDKRESDALYSSSTSQSSSIHIGFPLTDAVWRTNHGYDPVIRKHFEWSQAPSSWSMERYMFIHDALVFYQKNDTKIGVKQALNITAIVGDKGKPPYICHGNTDGTNVLSVTYQPQQLTLYTAWERSSGDNWRPAVCSDYIKFNLTDWFKPTPPKELTLHVL